MPRRHAGILLAILILAAGAPGATLKPGKAFRKDLAGGQSHSYSLALRAGEYVHAVALQQGVDVVLRLYAPDGRKLAEFDSPTGDQGPETLLWIADTSGNYRLEVSAVAADAGRGRYRLTLDEQRIATASDKKRMRAEELCGLASKAEEKETYREAIQYYEEALEIFRELHEREREATLLVWSAGDRENLHEFAEAKPEFESALAIIRVLGDRPNEAAVLARLGVNLRYLHRFDESVRALEQSVEIRRALHDRLGEAESIDRLGMTWSAQDRGDKALPYYQQALDLVRAAKGDPLELARELNNVAAEYAFLGQNQKAVDTLQEALAIVRRLKDVHKESVLLSTLGAVYDSMKQYEKATVPLEQALEIQERLPDYYSNRQITLANLGSAYQRLGQNEKAIAILERALTLTRAQKDRHSEGAILNLLGRAHRFLGQYDVAINYHLQARALLREIHSPEFEALSSSGLMFCWKDKGQPGIAIFFGKQAVNMLQSVRLNLSSLGREMQASFLKGNEEPYHGLAELLISAGRLGEAEQVMDLLKEQEYRDFVRRASDTASGAERRVDLTPAEAEWAQRDGERADRQMAIGTERGALLAKPSLTSDDQRRLDVLERDLEAANRKFQDFLESLGRDTGVSRVSAARLEHLREGQGMMEDLRDLPAGTVAIYTLVTEQKYMAILITPDVQKAYEYPIPAAELNRKILEFRQVLQDPRLDARPLAQKLFGILLGKMADDLAQAKAQTLMWSLDGCLRYLPIAALYDGRSYLIEQYRVSVFTPASNARLKERPSLKWQVLGLGVTKEQKGAPALPEVANELKGIGLPGEIVLDEQFTEASMRAGLRKRYPVVHIASHFHFQPGDESNSFLLLGDGSHFTLAELKGQTDLFRGVQLLTLSACSTGVSDVEGDGREVEGFGVLAQREGARAVVASLWSVADLSTSLMMQRFYRVRESATPMSKLDALRDAQLALLRGTLGGEIPAARRALIHDVPQPRIGVDSTDAPKFQPDAKAPYAHPYYWAAFYLMGNWL